MWRVTGCCFSAGVGLDQKTVSATVTELTQFMTILVREVYLSEPPQMGQLDAVSRVLVQIPKHISPDSQPDFWQQMPFGMYDKREEGVFGVGEFMDLVYGERTVLTAGLFRSLIFEIGQRFEGIECPLAKSIQNLRFTGIGSQLSFRWVFRKV